MLPFAALHLSADPAALARVYESSAEADRASRLARAQATIARHNAVNSGEHDPEGYPRVISELRKLATDPSTGPRLVRHE